jgi:hypothetical protein
MAVAAVTVAVVAVMEAAVSGKESSTKFFPQARAAPPSRLGLLF